MIFVSVGTQLPFDRLIRTVDEWVGSVGSESAFAQIGTGTYQPQHLDWQRELTPDEFQYRLSKATLVIAHAGIGTILSALEIGKPVIVMPRRASLSEHRNEHQLATAQQFDRMGLVTVAENEQRLKTCLQESSAIRSAKRFNSTASQPLLQFIESFLVT